jgi:hypothetical protein
MRAIAGHLDSLLMFNMRRKGGGSGEGTVIRELEWDVAVLAGRTVNRLP